MRIPQHIIISRTDSIGDIVLAMPVAAVLKQQFKGIKIALLGRAYTRDIALACEHIDEFISLDDFMQQDVFINGEKPDTIIHLTAEAPIAKRALKLKIPVRIGTSRRLFHLWTCNRFVWLNRKNSSLHESQLNLKLLKPLGIKKIFSLSEIANLYGLNRLQKLSNEYLPLLHPEKFNLIIHPKSRGSSREWPLDHFITLINLLDANEYNILLSGVEAEIPFVEQIAGKVNKPVINIAGKISLPQFIPLISEADAVLANSTGPVHIAAALGKPAIGIYPPLKTKDPGRWGPVGPKAIVFVRKINCSECKFTNDHCSCMNAIEPLSIKASLDQFMQSKKMSFMKIPNT